MSAVADIYQAIKGGDATALATLMRENPDQLAAVTPFAGGSWLHVAAREPHLDVVRTLVELGISPNKAGAQEAELPIVRAAHGGGVEIARYLLDQGSRMDTSASVRNPLFAAIVGRSADVVRLLLERGIDATVRYTSDTMNGMDATTFALLRGENEIAQIIALYNAGGDAGKAEALLAEARAIAAKQAPLAPTHIVPIDDDLAERGERPN